MEKLKKSERQNPQRGSFMIFSAIGGIFLIALTAMVTDVGWMYYNQARLNSAINAGWKAGFDYATQLGGFPLATSSQVLVKARVKYVITQNLGADGASVAANLNITFPNNLSLQVTGPETVTLMFSKVMDFNTAQVSASRAAPFGGAPLIPLGMPFGDPLDKDKDTWQVNLFATDSTATGFTPDGEYVLKLGGDKASTNYTKTPKLILLTMDNQPTGTKYLLGYGMAYWCLRIVKVIASDTTGDTGFWFPELPNSVAGQPNRPGHEGIEWLLGYRGGSFLLPYDNGDANNHIVYDVIKNNLDDLGLTYTIEDGTTNIAAVYAAVTAASASVLIVDKPRPRIAMYSSQPTPDPVEKIVRAAKIPYGGHPQVRAGLLSATFNASYANHIYDDDIIGGELDKTANGSALYTWLHCHHEDFTGFQGGCSYIDYTCTSNPNVPSGIAANYFLGNLSVTSSTSTNLCSYCRDIYFGGPQVGLTITYDRTQCKRNQKTPNCCRLWDTTYGPMNKTSSTNTDLCAYCKTFYFTSPVGWTGKAYATASCNIYTGNSSWYSCSAADASAVGTKSIKTSIAVNDLCPYCEQFYFYQGTNNWTSPKTKTFDTNSCKNYGLRCCDRSSAPTATGSVVWWRDLPTANTWFCQHGNSDLPQCCKGITDWNLATTLGYTDDGSYNPSYRWSPTGTGTSLVATDGSSNNVLATAPFVLHPSRVSKMKFDVIAKIRKHVTDGGYLFAQCHAAETMDLALWQRRIYLDQLSGANAVASAAYADCFSCTGVTYKAFPWSYVRNSNQEYYSTLQAAGVYGNFTLAFPLKERCQTHAGTLYHRNGATDSFVKSTLKSTTTVLGSNSGNSAVAEYIEGFLYGGTATGSFAFLGGHEAATSNWDVNPNYQASRLVLNNILLGAFSTKGVGTPPPPTKFNYGILNMANDTNATFNNYLQQLEYGYGQPSSVNDRVMPMPDNATPQTNLGVNWKVFGDQNASPPITASPYVIVPITDIPPEVKTNALGNPNTTWNASASTIYDIVGSDTPPVGVNASSAYQFKTAVRIVGYAVFQLIPPASFTRTDSDPNLQGQIRGKFVQYLVKPYEVPPN
ncbi:MAG: hypothetical protein HQM09_05245 [Candidatus Riflebacteria bacterium]|nr:hypothetical protein [Candidatus Riflebacteria bacterium]